MSSSEEEKKEPPRERSPSPDASSRTAPSAAAPTPGIAVGPAPEGPASEGGDTKLVFPNLSTGSSSSDRVAARPPTARPPRDEPPPSAWEQPEKPRRVWGGLYSHERFIRVFDETRKKWKNVYNGTRTYGAARNRTAREPVRLSRCGALKRNHIAYTSGSPLFPHTKTSEKFSNCGT